ncbi:YdeI/OmpD-associated family protein [Agromyces italicus]|uniref:YdeI/OmpD-associated family protein n=1 Tax=Agromyces italicus TaxID=279572 RepID=UPI0003B421C2|nr:YdeI/OmpD-associated family protein [Agromyces italicus]
MAEQFTAIVEPHEKMRGLEVPPSVVEALGGGRRPRVVVTIAGHSWRTRIAIMRGRDLIGFSNANRAATGAEVGDEVVIDLQLDPEPITVGEPSELSAALDNDPAARAAFEALTLSRRRQHARVIAQAKGADTRLRRVEKLLAELRGA